MGASGLWLITLAVIGIFYLLSIVDIIQMKGVHRALNNSVSTRGDLQLLKEAIRANKKKAMCIVAVWGVYLFLSVALAFALGVDFNEVAAQFFVFGIVVLPIAIYTKHVDGKLKRLRVTAGDPGISESYQTLLLQWGKPGFRV